MLRLILLLILIAIVARAFWRLMDGVIAGARGERSINSQGHTRGSAKAVQMARDPICGTFVVPERAVTLTVSGEMVHFCSNRCRDTYRTRDGSGRADAFRDRTA